MTSLPPPPDTQPDQTNGMQDFVRAAGLCGAFGNGRVCILAPHEGPHGFENDQTGADEDLAAAIFGERRVLAFVYEQMDLSDRYRREGNNAAAFAMHAEALGALVALNILEGDGR